jgi:hypothetical protein
MSELVCWKCGASLAALSLPLQRQDECRACHAQLHVCRLCEFHDVTVANQCREPIAEVVKDKDRANFCDYFKPRPGAYSDTSQVAAKAKSDLEVLFGAQAEATPAKQASAADRAREGLEKLFKRD